MSKIDLTELFNKNGLNLNSVMVSTNEYTYLPPSEPKTGWLPEIIELYSNDILSEYKNKDFFIVGSGAAVEGIAICNNLKPNKLFCSDINENVLPIAEENIRNNCNYDKPKYFFVKSDLVSYLIDKNIKVDIIHENLPNLPLDRAEIVFDDSNSASFYVDKYEDTPSYITKNRLELHYNLLLDSKMVLKENGAVISCIGSRIDFSIIKKMYQKLGYKIELIKLFMVEQLAADTVISGYIDTESKYGNSFHFFDYNSGKEKLKDLLSNNTDVDKIFSEMFKISFNSTEAYNKLQHEQMIGHLGLIIKAKLK